MGAMPQQALAIYDNNLTSRTEEIEANARLAGIHVSEVTDLAHLAGASSLIWTNLAMPNQRNRRGGGHQRSGNPATSEAAAFG